MIRPKLAHGELENGFELPTVEFVQNEKEFHPAITQKKVQLHNILKRKSQQQAQLTASGMSYVNSELKSIEFEMEIVVC